MIDFSELDKMNFSGGSDFDGLSRGAKRKLHNAERSHEGASHRKGWERISRLRGDSASRADRREARRSGNDDSAY